MKIIKEIEKSRLTEDGMQVITGGATNPGDQCSEEVTYRSCGSIGNITLMLYLIGLVPIS